MTPDASELDVRYLKVLLSSMLGPEAAVSLPDLVKVLNGGLDLQVRPRQQGWSGPRDEEGARKWVGWDAGSHDGVVASL